MWGPDPTASEVDLIAQGRLRMIPMRIGICGVAAFFFWEPPGTAIWITLALICQVPAFVAWSSVAAREMSYGWRVAAECLACTAYICGASVVWLTGGPGVPAATLLLLGFAMNAIVTTHGERRLLVALLVPTAITFVASPIAAAVKLGSAEGLLAIFAAEAAAAYAVFEASKWVIRLHQLERQARRVIEDARLKAEADTEAKSAFMAVVSHELRTPITAIVAGAGALESEAETPRAKSNAQLVASACGMLRTLLNDLLDYAKLEAGRMTAESIAFDLRDTIRQTVVLWRAEARSKGVRLRLAGARAPPRWTSGDPTRLKQILNNLLSNALKFTDAGSVTLRVHIEAGEILLAVKDTGPGMTVEQQNRLFRPFEQLSASDARRHGGSGLGLNISRQLAQLLGGDIEVVSAEGEGSTFTLRLPLRPAAAVLVDAGPVSSARAMDSICALVVDDHQVNRDAISLILVAAAIDVEVAASADEALNLLSSRRFDVVLLDLHLGADSGFGVSRSVRTAAGPNQFVPIIAVTGSAEESVVAACQAAGMAGHVEKPIAPEKLFTAIDAALRASNPLAA